MGALFGIVPPQACLMFKAKTTVQHILFLKSHTHLTASVAQSGVAAPWVLPYITEVLTLLCLQSGLFGRNFRSADLGIWIAAVPYKFIVTFPLMIHAYAGQQNCQKTYLRQNWCLKWPKNMHPRIKLKYFHNVLHQKASYSMWNSQSSIWKERTAITISNICPCRCGQTRMTHFTVFLDSVLDIHLHDFHIFLAVFFQIPGSFSTVARTFSDVQLSTV